MWKCSVPDSVERVAWGLGGWVKWGVVPVGGLWPGEAWSWQLGPRLATFQQLAAPGVPAVSPLPQLHPCSAPSAPLQMMQNLLLEEGGLVQVESVNLQVATYSKFQPQSPDFLDITNPKAVYPSEDGQVLCGRSYAGGG